MWRTHCRCDGPGSDRSGCSGGIGDDSFGEGSGKVRGVTDHGHDDEYAIGLEKKTCMQMFFFIHYST